MRLVTALTAAFTRRPPRSRLEGGECGLDLCEVVGVEPGHPLGEPGAASGACGVEEGLAVVGRYDVAAAAVGRVGLAPDEAVRFERGDDLAGGGWLDVLQFGDLADGEALVEDDRRQHDSL